jgi:hypothetical protein
VSQVDSNSSHRPHAYQGALIDRQSTRTPIGSANPCPSRPVVRRGSGHRPRYAPASQGRSVVSPRNPARAGDSPRTGSPGSWDGHRASANPRRTDPTNQRHRAGTGGRRARRRDRAQKCVAPGSRDDRRYRQNCRPEIGRGLGSRPYRGHRCTADPPVRTDPAESARRRRGHHERGHRHHRGGGRPCPALLARRRSGGPGHDRRDHPGRCRAGPRTAARSRHKTFRRSGGRGVRRCPRWNSPAGRSHPVADPRGSSTGLRCRSHGMNLSQSSWGTSRFPRRAPYCRHEAGEAADVVSQADRPMP